MEMIATLLFLIDGFIFLIFISETHNTAIQHDDYINGLGKNNSSHRSGNWSSRGQMEILSLLLLIIMLMQKCGKGISTNEYIYFHDL